MTTDTGWTAWTPAERESFFAAIARHRRAAWRVTFVSRAVNVVVALVVAVLMSPLFYAALALALDVLNLVVPAPNLVPSLGHALDRALNAPEKMNVESWIAFSFMAALPGLLWMGLVLNALRRVLRLSMSFDSGELAARAPDPTALDEQRFGNVVSEMAIAAALPPPRVFIVDSPIVDAVAFGTDERQSTVVISQGLLSLLNRAQMEGVAANLVAAIADGDMKIGVRAALSMNLFSLIALLGSLVSQKHARRNLRQILVATLVPTARSARKLVLQLANPFADEGKKEPEPANPTRWQKIRASLWLPLAGPLVITGFLGALVNLFILGPLLSFAWRQRKYMADATAVRLTRDPDTLAGALEQMTKQRSVPLAPWVSHMSVTDHAGRQSGVFGGSAVPMFPSIERRLRALGTLGAHITRAPAAKMPLKLWLIIGPLLAILVVCVGILLPMLVWLSLALTMLFGGIPFAIIHLLLRALGHH
ncbi:MAG: M48 family metalloprotease [Proteobacteria bacterium]|nr:M48 family metalloprotease [Pseudomonadota bacterium]